MSGLWSVRNEIQPPTQSTNHYKMRLIGQVVDVQQHLEDSASSLKIFWILKPPNQTVPRHPQVFQDRGELAHNQALGVYTTSH